MEELIGGSEKKSKSSTQTKSAINSSLLWEEGDE